MDRSTTGTRLPGSRLFRLPTICLFLCLACVRLSAQTILLDNFNADATGTPPSGWTSTTSGGTAAVQEVPSITDKSTRLAKTTSAGSAGIARSFTPATGKVAFEAKLRSEETTGTKNLSIYGSGGAAVATVTFSSGTIYASNGANSSSLQTYTAGTWYLIRLEIDTTMGFYDVYVNGVRQLTNGSLTSAGSDVARIACAIGDGSSGTAYFDAINIYTMAIPPAAGAYVAEDDFNAQTTGHAPAGWSTVTTGGTVTIQEVPFAADKSLCFQKATSANGALATRSFNAVSGKITVELKARAEDTSGYKNIAYLNSSDGTKAVSVAFNGSALSAYNGGTLQSVVTGVKTGTWYQIRIVLDTATAKYDLYVDGQRMITAGAFRSAVTNVASIQCGIDTTYLGTLYIDNLRVSTAIGLIGAPPAPIFDVASYGAVGDGVTKNTAAIQAAIDACAGTGGSVYLHDGTFLTGTIQVKSGMTLFIDASAVLLGSSDLADYPSLDVPLTGGVENIAMQSKLALVYLRAASNVVIDGGGRIDGNGQTWANGNGHESIHPMLIHPAMCNTLTVRNVYLERAAMWCVVPLESKYLAFRNVNLYSDIFGNRDGIDPVDCTHVLVDHCTIRSEDDSLCPKSGIRTGSDDLMVQNCFLAGSTQANGIKFGTRSYGQITNYTFQDVFLKNISDAALSLESVDGSDISGVTFRRIELRATNSPIYLTIGIRGMHPTNDVQKVGSIKNVLFEDISGSSLSLNTGSPISGEIASGVTYPLSNLTFRRVNITYLGGSTTIPKTPPEMGAQYPECTTWGNLPAYGYFLRHIRDLVFSGCVTGVSPADARPARTLIDVAGLQDNAVPAAAGNLVVTKLEYRPAPPSVAESNAGYVAGNFAFIELMNIGTVPIDLSGVTFTAGLNFTFMDFGPVHALAGGQRVLVVSNLAAFQFRYGTSLPIAGVFTNANALTNGGGEISLVASNGGTISDFTFSSDAPWPSSADGSGRALVLLHAATNPNPADPASWRASSSTNGAPGIDDRLTYAAWKSATFSSAQAADNSVSGPYADPDGDGCPNLLEYARGTNPLIKDATQTSDPFKRAFDHGQHDACLRRLALSLSTGSGRCGAGTCRQHGSHVVDRKHPGVSWRDR